MKKTIKVPILNCNIIVQQEKTLEACVDTSGIKLDTGVDGFHALTVNIGGRNTAVMFNETHCTPSIIAHEAKHVVNYIFTDIGYKLDNDNDEMECYFLGWVVDQLHKYLKVN